MYKVIFGVEKVSLNLNNINCQVVIRKNKEKIDLTLKTSIKKGQAYFDSLTQFFIIQNDPLFLIEVLLLHDQSNKLGGQASLNLSEWDQNTHISTIARLNKSPDPNASICYAFTYYKSDKSIFGKVILLCSQMDMQLLTKLKNENEKLAIKNTSLQSQIQNLNKQRLDIQKQDMQRKIQFQMKKMRHDVKIGQYNSNLNRKNEYFMNQQKLNNEMIDLVYSLGNKQMKDKLQEKYPLLNLPERNFNNKAGDHKLKRKNSKKSESSKEQNNNEKEIYFRKECYDLGEERERSRNKRQNDKLI